MVDELFLSLHDVPIGVVRPVPGDISRVTLEVERNYRHGPVQLSEAFDVIAGRRPPSEAVSNFLGSYVPEGNQRIHMANKRQIDKNNLFALLNEFGGSLAGAVTLKTHVEDTEREPVYEPLAESAVAAKLCQALTDSDQGVLDDSRSTLPGYQPKVLLFYDQGQWLVPHGNAHSTWILKPQVPARLSRIFDEHYSHLLTSSIGLSKFKSEIRLAGDVTYLAIERYDREVIDGTVRRQHQEDLAAAMSLDWEDPDVKFQSPEWTDDLNRASAKRIASTLGKSRAGRAAVIDWVRHLTFQLAVGDNDAHAKNSSLLHLPGESKLAPIYDALPNLFQDDRITWDLALSIDGEFNHQKLSVEHLLAEIDSWKLIPASEAERTVTQTLTSLETALEKVRPPTGITPEVPEFIHRNTTRLASGKAIGSFKH